MAGHTWWAWRLCMGAVASACNNMCGTVHVQVAMLNVTVTCKHPPSTRTSSGFRPSQKALIAVSCVAAVACLSSLVLVCSPDAWMQMMLSRSCRLAVTDAAARTQHVSAACDTVMVGAGHHPAQVVGQPADLGQLPS